MTRLALAILIATLASCYNWEAHSETLAAPASTFSSLADIAADNVKGLALTATFRTGASQAHAVAPIPGDLLLVLTPFPHTLFALDLTKPGLPEKWHYTPAADRTAMG